MMSQVSTLSNGPVVLVLLAHVNKITTTEIEDFEIMSKILLNLLESSRNNELKSEILRDVAKMKNKRYQYNYVAI